MMHYRLRLLSIFTVLLLVLGVMMPIAAQENTELSTRIDEFFINLDFSGSVLIAEGDQILLSKGYGLANREWHNPNAPDTKFGIASLTKQFTGMAILLLQEQGLLTVEDSICDYIEDCPEAWQDITIHHVLTHTSGIPDLFTLRDFTSSLTTSRSQKRLVGLLINEPLDFSPGEEWRYNNSGYVIAGYIIKEVSGSSYIKFLTENIFEPLGMENTGYDRNDAIIENRAEGYKTATQKADYIDMSNVDAAGALYSTTEDLFIWTRALHNGEIVSQESWDAMWEAAPSQSEGYNYGYGLSRGEIEGHLSISHAGDINGFVSFVGYYVEEDTTFILLSNIPFSLDIVIEVVTNWLFEEE